MVIFLTIESFYEYRALETEWIKRDEWENVIVSPKELAPLMPVTMTFVHSIIGKPRFVYRVKPVDAEETASQELIYEAGEVKILNAWDELFLGHVKRAFEL